MRKSFINYVCDEGSFRKKKDRFSNFSPILFFPAEQFEPLLEKTSLEPERRLGLAILEDTVAYYRRCVEKRNGQAVSRTGRAIMIINLRVAV